MLLGMDLVVTVRVGITPETRVTDFHFSKCHIYVLRTWRSRRLPSKITKTRPRSSVATSSVFHKSEYSSVRGASR